MMKVFSSVAICLLGALSVQAAAITPQLHSRMNPTHVAQIAAQSQVEAKCKDYTAVRVFYFLLIMLRNIYFFLSIHNLSAHMQWILEDCC